MKYVYRFGGVSVPVYDQEEACWRLDLTPRQLFSYINAGLLCHLSVAGPASCGPVGCSVSVFPCEEVDWIGVERVVYPRRSVRTILARRHEVNGPIFQLQQSEE
jgi:hypothetical protein